MGMFDDITYGVENLSATLERIAAAKSRTAGRGALPALDFFEELNHE